MEKDQPEAEWILNREKDQIILPFKDEDIWEEVAVWDLLKVFSGLVSSISMERVIDLYEEVTVNEKTTLIYEYLESKSEFAFTDVIKNRNSIYDIVCAFLAVLEMVRQKIISVRQNKFFGDIKISGIESE